MNHMIDTMHEKKILNLYYQKLNHASLAKQKGDAFLFTILFSQAEELSQMINALTELELN